MALSQHSTARDPGMEGGFTAAPRQSGSSHDLPPQRTPSPPPIAFISSPTSNAASKNLSIGQVSHKGPVHLPGKHACSSGAFHSTSLRTKGHLGRPPGTSAGHRCIRGSPIFKPNRQQKGMLGKHRLVGGAKLCFCKRNLFPRMSHPMTSEMKHRSPSSEPGLHTRCVSLLKGTPPPLRPPLAPGRGHTRQACGRQPRVSAQPGAPADPLCAAAHTGRMRHE